MTEPPSEFTTENEGATRSDQPTVSSLDELIQEHRKSADQYAFRNVDVLLRARDRAAQLYEEAKLNSPEFVDEISFSTKVIGDGDGGIAVVLNKTTSMGYGKGPMQSGYNEVFLHGVHLPKPGEPMSESVQELIEAADEVESSHGNIGLSVHFVRSGY